MKYVGWALFVSIFISFGVIMATLLVEMRIIPELLGSIGNAWRHHTASVVIGGAIGALIGLGILSGRPEDE